MAEILGITGNIGSGKSTLSNMLLPLEPKHALYETGQIIAELANEFNQFMADELTLGQNTKDEDIINQVLTPFTDTINEFLHKNVTWNQLALTKQRVAEHPQNYVKIFEYLKTVKNDPLLLQQLITAENKDDYRALLQWIGGYLIATVHQTIWTDEVFRRISKYDADKKMIVINALRYPADANVVRRRGGRIIEISRPSLQADTNDITEEQRNHIKPDIKVLNNGTLAQLQQAVEKMWFDISISQAKKEYKAD